MVTDTEGDMFLAGMVDSMFNVNKLEELKGCVIDDSVITREVSIIKNSLDKYDSNSLFEGLFQIYKVFPELQTVLSKCPNANDYIYRGATWFKTFKNVGDFEAKVVQGMMANYSDVMRLRYQARVMSNSEKWD